MRLPLFQFFLVRLAALLKEEGQDLTEYALTIAMVALIAVAGMGSLAAGITHTFVVVSTTLGQHLQ